MHHRDCANLLIKEEDDVVVLGDDAAAAAAAAPARTGVDTVLANRLMTTTLEMRMMVRGGREEEEEEREEREEREVRTFPRDVQFLRQAVSWLGAVACACGLPWWHWGWGVVFAPVGMMLWFSLLVEFLWVAWKDYRLLYSEQAAERSRLWLIVWTGIAVGAATLRVGTRATPAAPVATAVCVVALTGLSIKWVECRTAACRLTVHRSADALVRNPELSSGVCAYFMLQWVNPLMASGVQRVLEPEDVPELADPESTKHVASNLLQQLEDEQIRPVRDDDDPDVQRHAPLTRAALWMAVLRVNKSAWIRCSAYMVVSASCSLVAPVGLYYILRFVGTGESGTAEAPFHPAAMVAVFVSGQVMVALLEAQQFQITRTLGNRTRSLLSAALFAKAMRVSTQLLATHGELVNLVAVDTESVADLCMVANLPVHSGLQVILGCILLTRALGWAAVVGVLVLVAGIVATNLTMASMKKHSGAVLRHSAARMGILNQVVSGVKAVKLNAWEEFFRSKRIAVIRSAECRCLRQFNMCAGALFVLLDSLPSFVGIATFLSYTRCVLSDSGSAAPLDPWTAFYAFSMLSFLRFPLMTFPTMITQFSKGLIAMRRIHAFLTAPNVEPRRHRLRGRHNDGAAATPPAGTVLARGLCVSWTSSCDSTASAVETATDLLAEAGEAGDVEMKQQLLPRHISGRNDGDDGGHVLRGLTLDIPPGSLVCVVGPTGSGKSTLLEALLGEAKTVRGDWAVGGDVAYVSQKAWIRNATVRDNILFGKPMDADRYNKVIQACALSHDLSILANGDLTEIGERGVNLSGGQQQRVNLARAVYHGADLFLLDDVLSAVDAHVGEHLFHECVLGEMRDRTRILATHQLALTLPHADIVLVLDDDGRIVHRSSGQELVDEASDPAPRPTASASVSSFLQDVLDHLATSTSTSTSTSSSSSSFASGGAVQRRTRSPTHTHGSADSNEKPGVEEKKMKENEGHGRLVAVEDRTQGAPSPLVYLSYARAVGGSRVAVAVLSLFLAYELAVLGQSMALARWTTVLKAGENDANALRVYIGACVAVVVLLLGRTAGTLWASLRASRVIHDNMLASVLRAPLSWFESTPTGRILNRFSSDLQSVDSEAMSVLSHWLRNAVAVLVTVVVVCRVLPLMTVGMLPAVALSAWMGRRYLHTSRDLKRLESLQKSPVYAHFAESLNGVSTIRAFDQTGRFVDEFCARVDTRNRCFYWLWACNRWINLRMQLIGALITGAVAAYVVSSADQLSAGTAGLAMMYGIALNGSLLWTIRNHAELEMGMNAVERTNHYAHGLAQEASPSSSRERAPGATWPEEGHVVIKNLWMRYPSNPGTAVLKGVTMDIPGGMRVGIVGRTGAGKSSLIQCLSRLVEPDVESAIVIDGVNVLGDFGLADLRSRLAIVPQDPVLFQGTIRSNMDPFDEYNDEALWDALRKAHIAPAILALEDGLSAPVTEHGGNFSVGERQLLCMARAILKQSRVLIMDEATANVDPETDGLIQETVRHSLGACTVLCIAHRLHTVAYYDRVVVMDDGRVAEYDTPAALLQREDGAFRALCERSGNLEHLVTLATGK